MGWWDDTAMYILVVMLTISTSPLGSVPVSASLDCLLAEQGCIQEQSCMVLYRLLEYCAAEEAVSPLGPDARSECLEAQNSLQHYRPLQVCKCQRGSRREEHCLRVYWTVRFAGGFKHWHLFVCVCVCACVCVWWGHLNSQLHNPCDKTLHCCFSIWWVWSVSIWRTAVKSGEKHWDVAYGLHHGRYCSYHKQVCHPNICMSWFLFPDISCNVFLPMTSSFLSFCGRPKPVSQGSPGLWPVWEMWLPAVRICFSLHQACNSIWQQL